MDDFTASDGGFDIDRFWEDFIEAGRLTGSYRVKRFDGQIRSVVYAATANLVPGLHMAIFVSSSAASPAPEPVRRGESLTPRERAILQLIADGMTDREIASQLVLSPSTTRTHARNLMLRLGAHTRAQAVAMAIRRGEIVP